MNEISKTVVKIMIHEQIPFDWNIIDMMEKDMKKALRKK